MSTYTLTAPLIIGSRLMPALTVGDQPDTRGTIHAEIDHYDGNRYVLRYVIDYPGGTYEAVDIRSAVCHFVDGSEDLTPVLRYLFGALLSFLGAEAESYQACMREREDTPREGWSFSAEVAEWAYLNADEIAMAREELEPED